MIDKLIEDFDNGLKNIDQTDCIYKEYEELCINIEQDEELHSLVILQKELQFKILNFEKMNKQKFVDMNTKKLKQVDKKILVDKRIIRLRELNLLIELDKKLILDEINKLKLEWYAKYRCIV
ncbi:MAG: hypothetical protein ACRC5R_01450 [Mycoplasmatales bacterium]